MDLFREIQEAAKQLAPVVQKTPLMENTNLSEEFNATILLKREDLQVVRSYKIRGAYNKISSLTEAERLQGIVCASAGNHAQGVAYSCNLLQIKGIIYMPKTTPNQKIKQVQLFGKKYVEIILTGDTFDDAFSTAISACEQDKSILIHPFDDINIE
jgi:threonine dehydratase